MTDFAIIRTIPLTQGKVAIVDQADYSMVARFRWRAVKRGTVWYAAAACDGRQTYMHRMVLGLSAGDGIEADHINRDGLDNRRSNLRRANRNQQNHNQVSRGGLSRFKGVALDRRDGVWYAHITADSVRYYLGRFNNEVSAALAYDRAAREMHGSFARTNFPEQEAS